MSREMTESRHPQDDDFPTKPSHPSSGTTIGRGVEHGADAGQPRPFFARRRKSVLVGSAILTLAAVSGLICLLVKKPWSAQADHPPLDSNRGLHGEYSDEKGNNGKDGKSATLTRFSPGSAVDISSSVRCNAYTPALDQPFLYGQQPIRGVNIGGWLVLEPFITPSLFEPFLSQNVTDEYTLSKALGPEKAKVHLQKHYENWVTEATFKRIRDLGLNHVRIPVGFWALGNLAPDEPYVPDLSLDYLLQGLRWAAKYGLRVMVELHGAPGSQNGWNHSGHGGNIRWLDGTAQGEKNGERTIAYMKQLLLLLQGPGMEHVSPMFGILNEPAIFLLERERTDRWYKEAFAAMRNITGAGKGQWGVIHDGFLGLTDWEGFMPNSDRLVLDVHQYMIFNNYLIRLPRKDQVNFPCDVWSRNMQQSTLKFGPTLVGEFSSATNDCATYLNGIGVGYRWDGTFQTEEDRLAGKSMHEAACQPAKHGHIEGYCSCQAQNRVGTYSQEYRKFLSDFTQTQMDAFEQGIGWFYWNFKTETNALWSYFDGVDQGWIPKDANNRPGGCKALDRAIQPFQK